MATPAHRLNVVNPAAPSPHFPPSNYAGAELFPYPLDPFQTHAVTAICAGENLMSPVMMPTEAAGKALRSSAYFWLDSALMGVL